MARQYRCVLGAILVVASPLLSEGSMRQTETPSPRPTEHQQQARNDGRRADHDRRRSWWKDPGVIAEIGLTAEQSTTIDGIFTSEIEKMKPLRESVNEHERALNDTIRANAVDVAIFRQRVEKIERKRAELNTMRTVMLYRIRRVLTADQNAKLHAMWDRERRQDGDRRH